MPELDFWRIELWHPLSVHFPITLLLLAPLTLLVSFIVQQGNKVYWRNASMFILIAGSLTAWIAVYTGGLADGIVSRKICDPTVLKDHEIAGELMAYLSSGAALLLILRALPRITQRLGITFLYLSFLMMLVNAGYVVYTAHLGASLVYQQGAGVRNHVDDCSDYE